MFFQIELFVYLNDNIQPFCDVNLIAFQGLYSLLHFFLNINCDYVLFKKTLPIYLQPFLIHFAGKVLIFL